MKFIFESDDRATDFSLSQLLILTYQMRFVLKIPKDRFLYHMYENVHLVCTLHILKKKSKARDFNLQRTFRRACLPFLEKQTNTCFCWTCTVEPQTLRNRLRPTR